MMKKLLQKWLSRGEPDTSKITKLTRRIAERDTRIVELKERIGKKNAHIAALSAGMSELIADKEVLLTKAADVRDEFHRLYYHTRAVNRNSYMGHPILQCPMDMQVYQEIFFRVRPRCVIQTGVFGGGSLLYFAHLLDLLGMDAGCRVIGIDIDPRPEAYALKHPRIDLIKGSSVAPDIVRQVEASLPPEGALVSLDSDHREPHVSQELLIYREYVAPGSYLVVEDTNMNNRPVLPDFGPGPYEAVEAFLKKDTRFISDDEVWKHNLFSFHQQGWLRRI
jgi:cephalosporin hydroxylase